MTPDTLTPERLAELRAIAEAATPGSWTIDPDDREGMEWNNHIVAADKPWLRLCFMTHTPDDDNAEGVANAVHIASFDPPTVLALIAQCEAGLPASGGVSGEDGELIAKLRKIPTSLPGFKLLYEEAADRITALLAERDGLKEKQAGYEARPWHKHMRETEAALADALGLLREAVKSRKFGDVPWEQILAFLAKHGPSP